MYTCMDSLTIAAASGLRARMEALDLLANNIANANTAGYKADRESYSLYLSPEAGYPLKPVVLPTQEKKWTDYAQGNFTETGGQLDLALSGEGFFGVTGASGPLYTRNGNFRLSRSGTLETIDGLPVRDKDAKAIKLDSRFPIDIGENGEIRQQGRIVSKLEIVKFPRPQDLAKQGQNYYQWSSTDVPTGASAAVLQGRLESANSSPTESAVRLVSVLRQFEMLQRALSMSSDMGKLAVEEVAKAGG